MSDRSSLRSRIAAASVLLGLLSAAVFDPRPAAAEARAPFDRPDQVTLTDYLPQGAVHDPGIPVPASVLGHEIGARHARHDAMVAWFEALADASARVQLREIGRTWEGRRQITAVIGTPQHLADLEALRARHLAGDPTAPLFIWLGYSVHGNEASGLQASMAVAYHLAAGRGDTVASILDNAIVLIDPSINPDGYGRFSAWADQAAGRRPVGDADHRERAEPWPGGRTNHYFFDLNRDWLLLQHPESRNRVQLIREFRPHVMTDHHEMGGDSTFFFQPGVPSRRNPLIPDRNTELTAALGEFHARSLDAAGRSYFSEEAFDDFYPGKGSTWPDLQGTVGILFEQASTRGLTRDTRNGLLTLPMAVHNHVLASFSTLEGAVALGEELKAYRSAYLEGQFIPAGLPAAWVIDLGNDRDRANGLLDVLRGQGLEARVLDADLRADEHLYPAGNAIIVPVQGPESALAQTLFAPITEFADSTFYDISTWSLQYAFGLRAAPVRRMPAGTRDLDSLDTATSGIAGGTDSPAWALRWDRFTAPAVLQRIHEHEIRVQLAMVPFAGRTRAGTADFDAGTLILQRADLAAAASRENLSIEELLTRMAGSEGLFEGLASGLTGEGPELGSRSMPVLAPTRLAVLAGDGVRSYSAGTFWHLFDARLGIPTSLIKPTDLDAAVLARHTHLLMPDGRYGELDEATLSALDRWVRAGGTLITIRGATDWAIDQEWLPQSPDPQEQDGTEGPAEALPFASMAAEDGAQQIGGAILEVELDRTHPLAFGIDLDRVGLLRRGRHPLTAPSDNPFTVVGAYTESPWLSGYLPEDFAADIAGEPAILAVPRGSGVVIAFADAPAFRAVWWIGQRLVANALSFSQVLEAPDGDYGPER